MGNFKIDRMTLGMFQTNCYFVYFEEEKKAIVFDPADDGERIAENLKKNGISVEAIMITHGHFDHILGCADLKKIVDEDRKKANLDPIKVYACESERSLLVDIQKNVSMQMSTPCKLVCDEYLKDGDQINIAGMEIQVIETPGHTEGGCCYLFVDEGLLISGDTLFLESVGRTDFPTGSASTLVRSIKEKLFVLPDDTRVYPGHGDLTSIAHEKKYNPFCCD